MFNVSFKLPPDVLATETVQKRIRRVQRGPSQVIAETLGAYRSEFQPGDWILELASGEGRNLTMFKDWGCELHGIEIDGTAIEMCNQLLQHTGTAAQILQGSFTDLSAFPDQSFRLVYTQSSIQNAQTITDVELVFSEARRVLKPGGLFLLRESSMPRHLDAGRQRRVAYFTEEELHGLVRRHGFAFMSGDKPEDIGPDDRRVGGRKVVWTAVLRKQ
ncbi:MAG: methyltransferase domain-containing protein [Patescibacteria group bacterium]